MTEQIEPQLGHEVLLAEIQNYIMQQPFCENHLLIFRSEASYVDFCNHTHIESQNLSHTCGTLPTSVRHGCQLKTDLTQLVQCRKILAPCQEYHHNENHCQMIRMHFSVRNHICCHFTLPLQSFTQDFLSLFQFSHHM